MTYRAADWKPGDVAMVTTWSGTRRAQLSQNRNWCWGGGVVDEDAVTDARPLVTLDPESDEDVQRLGEALAKAGAHRGSLPHVRAHAACAAALRSLTRPPKPDEPKGRAAVVVDRKGRTWARVDRDSIPWRRCGGDGRYSDWDGLDVPADGVKFGGVS